MSAAAKGNGKGSGYESPAASLEPLPCVLLVGDEFLVRQRAAELVDAWVPEASRSLNLVSLEGASTDAGTVAHHLAQVPMFRGTMVVLVHDTILLAGKKDLAVQLHRALTDFEKGRVGPATRRALSVCGTAGWDLETLLTGSKTRFKKELGLDRSELPEAFLKGVSEHATLKDWKVPASETASLERLLAESAAPGRAPGNILILSAGSADKKHPLTKLIATLGRVETLKAAQSGAKVETLDISAVRDEILGQHGKRLDPEAERLLKRSVGSEMRLLASELEKLCLYVGERPRITEADVLELGVSRIREEAFWELGSALSSGQFGRSMFFLADAFEHRHAPLQVLGSVSAALRGSLQLRVVGERHGLRKGRAPTPAVTEEIGTLRGRKPHPFALQKEWERASGWPSSSALMQALEACARCDSALKGSGVDGRLLLEHLALKVCGLHRQTATPGARSTRNVPLQRR